MPRAKITSRNFACWPVQSSLPVPGDIGADIAHAHNAPANAHVHVHTCPAWLSSLNIQRQNSAFNSAYRILPSNKKLPITKAEVLLFSDNAPISRRLPLIESEIVNHRGFSSVKKDQPASAGQRKGKKKKKTGPPYPQFNLH